MEIRAEHSQDKSVIWIDANKLTGIENETFQNFVLDSINKGSKNITVDLSKVEFISSWGIGVLVHAYTTCIKRNVRFNVICGHENVMNVLHQTKLDTLFEIS